MQLEIRKAVRRALPMQIAMYGPSGSGKTFSALMFATGLAPDGKIAVVDTERGRASIYADNKKILSVMPNGFDVVELDPPYHPKRYIEAMDLVERAGYGVCIIDSGSDSWDGPGGCTDLAEQAKNMWTGPKMWNKRMMTRAALSDMHVIWLLKAQEKTKVLDKSKSGTGKQEYIDLGVLPIWEKNNFYPMLLGFSIDPKTHVATAVKCHDDLIPLFREPRLLSKADGEKVRLWNESGASIDPHEQVKKRARAAAEDGMQAYGAFFGSLTKEQKAALVASTHEDNKRIAENADKSAAQEEAVEAA